ncbi:AraC family transcriptional regulator [Pantoea sp. B65]|uniref:helix-turn-helix transcriptional regulator n=1 Tax=Pantoea sp. B65 TaxID=2813359 RepID=UPI0039B4B819
MTHDTQAKPERLELISLNNSIVSFSRLYANTVRYHHWHQCIEILYVEQGHGVVIVDNKHYTMRPGRLFIFPPFTLHKVMVEESDRDIYRRTIIHVDHYAILGILKHFPLNQNRLRNFSKKGGAAFVADVRHIHAYLEVMFDLYNKNDLNTEGVACLLLNLFSVLPEEQQESPEESYRLSTQVLFWIEENYTGKFSLDKLAADINKSRSYISRRFQYETGEKIHDYITIFRLRKACELLLHESLSINDIAAKVGFSDVTYFISSFKKGIGETPLQYRKHHSARKQS